MMTIPQTDFLSIIDKCEIILFSKKVRSAYGAEDGDAVSICYTDRCTPPTHVWVHTDAHTQIDRHTHTHTQIDTQTRHNTHTQTHRQVHTSNTCLWL